MIIMYVEDAKICHQTLSGSLVPLDQAEAACEYLGSWTWENTTLGGPVHAEHSGTLFSQ